MVAEKQCKGKELPSCIALKIIVEDLVAVDAIEEDVKDYCQVHYYYEVVTFTCKHVVKWYNEHQKGNRKNSVEQYYELVLVCCKVTSDRHLYFDYNIYLPS